MNINRIWKNEGWPKDWKKRIIVPIMKMEKERKWGVIEA